MQEARKLTLRRDGPSAWLLTDATGRNVGGITYTHAADGRHYQPWKYGWLAVRRWQAVGAVGDGGKGGG
jgi:hypothetical protein